MSKKRNLTSSFKYAGEGIKEAFKNEPNFRIHIIAAIAATLLGFYFKLSQTEWMILYLTIAIVMVLELVNTAIEAIVDIVSPKFSKLARTAKDVSAAAVLVSSLAALGIGMLLFLPRIIK